MSTGSFDSLSPQQPAAEIHSLASWLRQRVAAYKKIRELKRQQQLLSNLDSRGLADMDKEAASARRGAPQFVYLMPHLVVGAGLYRREE